MDERSLYNSLEESKKDITAKFGTFKDEIDRKFDKLFNYYDEIRSDITAMKTHFSYTKEKFEEIKDSLDKEVELIWKEIGNQKSEMLHNLNSGIKSEREIKQKDLESCRILMQQKIETLKKSIDEIEAQAHLVGEVNAGRFWKSIAVALISALLSFLGSLIIRHIIS